jgi:hypothetical protein
MKIPSFGTASLALVAAVVFFTSMGPAPAQLNIQIGGPSRPPPPPPPPEHRWHEPYHGAYWIRGHNEWRDGRWVWIGGYYGYPPYPGAVWIEGRIGRDGNWRPGHWSNR